MTEAREVPPMDKWPGVVTRDGALEALWQAIKTAEEQWDGGESRSELVKDAMSDALFRERLVIVPVTAPDASFDMAWERLGEDRFTRIRQKLSVHDARVLFRAVWAAMVCACDGTERDRLERLKAAAAKIVEPTHG